MMRINKIYTATAYAHTALHGKLRQFISVLALTILCCSSKVHAATYNINPGDDLVGEIKVIYNADNSSFAELGRVYGVSFNELVAANPSIDPWIPGKRKIIIPNLHLLPAGERTGIVINVSQLRLYYFEANGSVVHTYPIGIGKQGWQTPTGSARITYKEPDPTWNAPESIIEEARRRGQEIEKVFPPGPDNPLGKYALHLSLPSILIHGTNNPMGVGRRVSHGCIRMYPEDIEKVFDMVSVGTKVRIVHQSSFAGIHKGKIYVAVTPEQLEHRTGFAQIYAKLTDMIDTLKVRTSQHEGNLDMQILKPLIRVHDGIPLDLSKM